MKVWAYRAPTTNDFPQWSALYRGYREFSQVAPDDSIVERVWSWIQDSEKETGALISVADDGTIGGLAHYRRFDRPLSGTVGLYLDDLFTRENLRGQGIARGLLNALSEIAASEGLSVVRWITAADNETARRLYDTEATATQWVTYDKSPAHHALKHDSA